METSTDTGPFDATPANTSNKGIILDKDDEDRNLPPLPLMVDPKDLYYDMSGNKYMIIFKHTDYKKTRYFRYERPKARKGADNDEKRLKEVFGKLNFKIVVHTNLLHEDIKRVLKEVIKDDHKKTSCICVVILTHGDSDGELFAADRPYKLSEVTSIFETCQDLGGKPKLFFVQACRGSKFDDGMKVQRDGGHNDTKIVVIPSHADFLILYSSVEDYVGFRDENGSWMIQELCNAVDGYHQQWDILHIITLVNRRVAFDRASYVPRDLSKHNKKQMPETRFTLTKLLKLA